MTWPTLKPTSQSFIPGPLSFSMNYCLREWENRWSSNVRPGHKQRKGRDPWARKASRLFTADQLLMGRQGGGEAGLHSLIQLFSASMLGRHGVDTIVHITRGISSLIKGTDVKEVLNWTLRFDHVTYCLQAFYQIKGFKYLRLGSRSSQNHIFVQSSFSTPCFFLDSLLGSKAK